MHPVGWGKDNIIVILEEGDLFWDHSDFWIID
jgi:hypothetical protein